MIRYLRSSRSSSGGSSSTRSTAQLREQFIQELTSEANSVLKQLSDQFTQSLQSQASQLLQGTLGGASGDGLPSLNGISQLFSTGVRYLASQPTTTTSTTESARSQSAQSQFQLSQAQALAEANMTIAKGDKNL